MMAAEGRGLLRERKREMDGERRNETIKFGE